MAYRPVCGHLYRSGTPYMFAIKPIGLPHSLQL
jgi:hypothetical protein